MSEQYLIAWWNLENLFNVENWPDRPEWLANQLATELAGWDQGILDKKCTQLARVIKDMNGGGGPDILGVCEIECVEVLQALLQKVDLPDRSYGIVHHDSDDKRGIDVAFVYDQNKFTAGAKFDHVVLKRNATRDIFQVNFETTAGNNPIVLIANHWPSRLGGGKFSSEPYRIVAAETLSYWLSKIPEKFDSEPAIMVMGDFNDEPYDRAITDYALAIREKRRVASSRSQKPYLYNLSWSIYGAGSGTYYYGKWDILDQMMVNRPLVQINTPVQYQDGSFSVFRPDYLLKNGKPRRFGRPSKRYDEGGFSDHLPVTAVLREL